MPHKMRNDTKKIPFNLLVDEDKSIFFQQLIDSLDFVKPQDIPEWQKKELDKRRAEYLNNPEILLDADKVFKELDKEIL
jgi:hypothetical protein